MVAENFKQKKIIIVIITHRCKTILLPSQANFNNGLVNRKDLFFLTCCSMLGWARKYEGPLLFFPPIWAPKRLSLTIIHADKIF